MSEGIEDDLFGTAANGNLIVQIVQVSIHGQASANSRTQRGQAIGRRVTEVLLQRVAGRIQNMFGGAEVRLAQRQIDNILTFGTQLGGATRHQQNGRLRGLVARAAVHDSARMNGNERYDNDVIT